MSNGSRRWGPGGRREDPGGPRASSPPCSPRHGTTGTTRKKGSNINKDLPVICVNRFPEMRAAWPGLVIDNLRGLLRKMVKKKSTCTTY